ncbi:MAG: hypothetical protein ABR582_11675 [Gemmatimonadaceae bacterium]
MDKRKLAALAKKNAAKSGTKSKIPKGFGKKYSSNLADDPVDEETIKERDRAQRFFTEMRKREF